MSDVFLRGVSFAAVVGGACLSVAAIFGMPMPPGMGLLIVNVGAIGLFISRPKAQP